MSNETNTKIEESIREKIAPTIDLAVEQFRNKLESGHIDTVISDLKAEGYPIYLSVKEKEWLEGGGKFVYYKN